VDGEGPLDRVALGFLGVHGSVPVVADLHRVRPEPLLALRRPPVRRINQVVAEQPHGLLVRAQRRTAKSAYSTQIGAPLVDRLRYPRPRVAARMLSERSHPA